jgi:hypothetical protein
VPRHVTSAPLPAAVSPGRGHDDGPLLLLGRQRWNIVVPREREQGSTGVQDGAGWAHGDRGRPVVAGRDPSQPVTRANAHLCGTSSLYALHNARPGNTQVRFPGNFTGLSWEI